VVNVSYATATGYHSKEGPVRSGRVRIKLTCPEALVGDIPFHCHLVDHESMTGALHNSYSQRNQARRHELNIVQEGLPDVIRLEACYLGWQDSLQNLAKLVEPEINQ
jgi:hypothetical protein